MNELKGLMKSVRIKVLKRNIKIHPLNKKYSLKLDEDKGVIKISNHEPKL